MAGSGTTFEIDIPVAAQGVEPAAMSLARMADALTSAGQASEAAAAAMRTGEAAYKAAESAADRAAKSLEKINIAAEDNRSKMAAALAAGDASKFASLSGAADKLAVKQAAAAKAADAAKAALAGEALSLDKLKASAAEASASEAKLAKSHEAMQKSTAAAAKSSAELAKAQEKARGSGNFNELADGVKKLGGPLGKAADFAGDASEGFDKLGASLGSAGLVVGVAAAAAAAIAVVSAAAIKATASILMWGIGLADTNKDLERLQKKWDTTIAKTFGGLKIDGLLGGLERLIDLFDETSVTGKAIKVVFESLFQPLVDGLTSLVPHIVKAFIQFEIWVLKALIAIKPFGSTIVTAGKIIGVALLAVVAAIGLVVGAFIAVGAAMALALGYVVNGTSLFTGLGVSIREGVGKALDWLTERFNAIVEVLSGLSLSDIGLQLVTGLAQGIMSGGSAVLSAITGVVDGAISAAKGLLGIASPSKVFAEIGANTAEGMSGGVESGSSAVQGSLERMVSPPEAAGGATGGSSGEGAKTFIIHVNASSGEAEGIASEIRKVVLEILDGTATELLQEVPV